MKDAYGRTIDYMRISITDRCNLRCKYCMPHGIDAVSHQDILTFEEIRQVVWCAARLGIRHIKVTGGEPLVRKGCCALVRILKAVPGIEHVTLTTNGVLLEKYLDELIRSGIDGINISLDTTDRELYRSITGQDCLSAVLGVLEKASSLSVPLKINAVSVDWEKTGIAGGETGEGRKSGGRMELDRGIGENWKELALLAKRYPVDVRFIEMMPIGCGKEYRTIHHETLLERMTREFPGIKKEESTQNPHGFGPAVYYRIPGFLGSIGLISAVHEKFCAGCNRVRLTSQGYLKTCLCFEDGADLRAILRDKEGEGEQDKVERRYDRLTAAMERAINEKPAAHCFDTPEKITERHNMVDIGG